MAGAAGTIVPFSVQFVNIYPAFAAAITVTEEPELNVPAPVVTPPNNGFDDTATVYDDTAAV